MKKIISLLLVLALFVCLPLCAFAEEAEPVNSPGGNAPTGDTSGVLFYFALVIISAAAIMTMNKLYKKEAM